jgi:hypothetical protein
MSRRIAHRPRYHSTRYTPYPTLRSHHPFLPTRWSYRRQTVTYQKRKLGQSLLLIPWGYRLFQGITPLIR